ncbi:MAG: molybdenum ABC transporter ATP-binding protein [Gammaproteobacteria bacterium]|nr:molybdenum ABC transporter ATP-binding protein [Gammaproteobacteria bacterium]
MSSSIHFHFELHRPGFTLDARGSLPARGINALFGESGCGKTTLLRSIAGLETGIEGQLLVHDECWFDSFQGRCVPAHRRSIGFVFQENSLFPHLNVHANLLYGWRRTPRKRRQKQPDQVIEMLGLEPLLLRNCTDLSGGERQRVAIGRALLNSPRLLLMDEPLSALDRRRKQEILPYLERLHAQAEIPIIYVTHDLEELVSVADHLSLMESGRIIRSGPIEEMLIDTGLSIATEENAGALLSAEVEAHDEQFKLTRLIFPGGSLTIGRIDKPQGARVRLRIHAKDVSLAMERPGPTSILNILPATVLTLTPQGNSRVIVSLSVGESTLLARITRKSESVLQLRPGCKLFAQIKSVALHT